MIRRNLVAAAALWLACSAAAPPTSDLDAALRATGSRKDVAMQIGRVLFATRWPAQILKVRVEGAGSHLIAGLTVSGVKFHENLDRLGFLNEIELLVARTFGAAGVEEVDLWVTVPKPYDRAQPVSGDLAVPTTRVVFAATCRRSEMAQFGARLRSGTGVFWAKDFLARLRIGRSAG